MKRFILCMALVITIIGILLHPVTSGAFLAFLFLGIIPGTSVQIPFWVMTIAFLGGSYLLIQWLKSQPLFFGGLEQQELVARRLARKKIVHSRARYTSTRTVARKNSASARRLPIRRSA